MPVSSNWTSGISVLVIFTGIGMARILHTRAGERYRADVVRAPRDKGGITGGFFAIALLSIIGFGHALTFGFVYDDHWTVEGNRALDLGLVPLLGTLLSGQGVAR